MTGEVATFGCRLNIYESEIIRRNLKYSGADGVKVFNTCSVTDEAEKEAIKAIRKAKKDNPDLKIIVTGCAVQNKPTFFAAMPEVDRVLGNIEKLSPDYYLPGSPKFSVSDISSIKSEEPILAADFEGRSRAFLEIQNGCDHRCTFCNIPFARGPSRSVPLGAIVKNIRAYLEAGYREIVFTGVDITSYGSGLPGAPTLARAIKRTLSIVPELPRLRLSSIDVAEIDEELFDLMAYEPRLMPHFHISLQSGDNMVLKRMKRRHNREKIIDFCSNLRAKRPEVAFGADIIAGFPTETEEMFENTRKLISEASLQYLHIFPYSEREGTPAAKMPSVEKSVRKERASILREEGKRESQKFFSSNIGRVAEFLVEKNGKAHSDNFIPTELDKDFPPKTLVKAKFVKTSESFMSAEAV